MAYADANPCTEGQGPDPPPVVEAAHSAASTTGGGPVGDFRMEIPVLLTANIQLVGS